MKKSVVILIAIIYIASIALVSFFGLQFKVFNEEVLVEKIELRDPNLKKSETWGQYTLVEPDESGKWHYQIEYRVYPEDATNSGVKFAFTEKEGVTVDENGLVTFDKAGRFISVQLIPEDGSDVSTMITILSVEKGGAQ